MTTLSRLKQTAWIAAGTAALTLLFSACANTATTKARSSMSPNERLLAEVNRAGAWFHARKTRSIWAKKIDSDQTVHTLEGKLKAKSGDFLCRGEAGEIWPQKETALESKYSPTTVVDGDGWRKYDPRPDAEGILAAQVNHPFKLKATWGILSGKAGDYVAKNLRDRDVAYPEDVWVVDQKLFLATYEPGRE
jgi:hypothetical protein